MTHDDHRIDPGSEMDIAIDRALEGANLRAGDAGATWTAFVAEPERSAVEDGIDGADGD